MPLDPHETHPDRWIHERLRRIEMALDLLLLIAQSQPGVNAETQKLVEDVRASMRGTGEWQKPGQ